MYELSLTIKIPAIKHCFTTIPTKTTGRFFVGPIYDLKRTTYRLNLQRKCHAKLETPPQVPYCCSQSNHSRAILPCKQNEKKS